MLWYALGTSQIFSGVQTSQNGLKCKSLHSIFQLEYLFDNQLTYPSLFDLTYVKVNAIAQFKYPNPAFFNSLRLFLLLISNQR